MTLENLLGPATIVVRSGGRWINGGQPEDKLHVHWRLKAPATGKALTALKQARDLATRLVGGDPSNKPVCHPIRWPGSWHRKAEPRLCQISQVNADIEIGLEAALAILQAAAPPQPQAKSSGSSNPGDSSDWYNLVNGSSPVPAIMHPWLRWPRVWSAATCTTAPRSNCCARSCRHRRRRTMRRAGRRGLTPSRASSPRRARNISGQCAAGGPVAIHRHAAVGQHAGTGAAMGRDRPHPDQPADVVFR